MTDLRLRDDGLPLAAPLLQHGPHGKVKRLVHTPILGKFSSDGKEHFTKRLGHAQPMSEKDSINQVLAENLAHWMGERKLTQNALAEKAGVSQKTISNYLNPEQRVDGAKGKEPSAKLTELNRIAGALGVGVWELVRRMSERERALYTAIEKQYEGVRQDAKRLEEEAAQREEENQRALEAAKIPVKNEATKKSARSRK